MRRVYIILLIFLLTTGAFANAKISVKVLNILDGDTIKVKLDSGNKFSIRLIGIDCCETNKINRAYKQAYVNNISIEEVIKQGEDARKYLENLYKNTKEVSFDFRGIDRYGRALGVVWFDKVNVNEELKNKGICAPFVFIEK